MILGIGVDVVHLPAFRDQLADRASHFVDRTFTAEERATAEAGRDPARHLGTRFAAKEAFIKAWSGARFGEPPALPGADLSEVEVVKDAWGRPALRLHGAVARAVAELGPTRARLSLSHDGPMAIAMVTLSRAEVSS